MMGATTRLNRLTPLIAFVRFFAGAYWDYLLITGALIALIAGGVLTLRWPWPTEARAQQPIVLIATPTMGTLPTNEGVRVASALTLPATVAAFAAPNGAYLGTAPEGAAYTAISRNPEGWLLVRVAGVGGYDGQGLLWLAPNDAPGEVAQVPVIATPAPLTVYQAPAGPPAPGGGGSDADAPAVVAQPAVPAPAPAEAAPPVQGATYDPASGHITTTFDRLAAGEVLSGPCDPRHPSILCRNHPANQQAAERTAFGVSAP